MWCVCVCVCVSNNADLYALNKALSAARDAGVSVTSVKDQDGNNALHLAVLQGCAPAVAFLLDNGVDASGVNAKGLTAFHYAAYAGDLDTARLLASKGSDVSRADNAGRHALHLAAVQGHLETVQWLVGRGLSPHSANNDGLSAVHFAAMGGHVPVLQWFHDTGVDLHRPTPKGMVPLLHACLKGHAATVQWLHAQGQLVTEADADGRTALHLAVASNAPELVTWLLANGVDHTAKDGQGVTPLVLSSRLSGTAPAIVVALKAASAPPGPPPAPSAAPTSPTTADLKWAAPDRAGCPPVTTYAVCVSEKWSLGWSDHPVQFDTPFATLRGLKPGATYAFKVKACNVNGWGPLSTKSQAATMPTADATTGGATGAASGDTNAGAAPAVGAKPMGGRPPKSPALPAATAAAAAGGAGAGAGAGGSATSSPAATASPGAASSLAPPTSPPAFALASPPSAHGSPSRGHARRRDGPLLPAAIVDAARSGDTGALSALWSSRTQLGPDVGPAGGTTTGATEFLLGTDDKGMNVLHHAAHAGHPHACKWLVQRGLSVHATDARGATPLLFAVLGNHVATVRYLAAKGAPVNAADHKGFSALHYAAMKNHLELFQWLLEAGAKPNVRTTAGQPVVPSPPATTNQRRMLAMLSNVALPVAPPPPVFVDSTADTVRVRVMQPLWPPGRPPATHYEVQYGKKFSIGWSPAAPPIPTRLLPRAGAVVPGSMSVAGTASIAASRSVRTASDASDASRDLLALDADAHSDAMATPPPAKPAAGAGSPALHASPASASPVPNGAGGDAFTLAPDVSGTTPGDVLLDVRRLAPATKYTVKARARNRLGWGPWSPQSAEMSTVAGDADRTLPPLPNLAALQLKERRDADSPSTPPPPAAPDRGSPSSPMPVGSLDAALAAADAAAARQPAVTRATLDVGPAKEVQFASEGNLGGLLRARTAARLRNGLVAAHTPDGAGAGAGAVGAAAAADDTTGVNGADASRLSDAFVWTPSLSDHLEDKLHFMQLVCAAAFAGQVATLSWLVGEQEAAAEALRRSAADVGGGANDPPPTRDGGAAMACPPAAARHAVVHKCLSAVNAFMRVQDPCKGGRLPLHVAALGGSLPAVQFLLAASVAPAGGVEPGALSAAALADTAVSMTTSDQANVLHLACYAGGAALASWLTDAVGLTLTTGDTNGWLPAHYAAMGGSTAGLDWLAAAHSSADAAWLSARDHQGRTPLHMIALCGHIDALRTVMDVLEAAAAATDDPSARVRGVVQATDSHGMTPLHCVAMGGGADALSIAMTLLAAGASARVADDVGRTPYALACHAGNVEVMDALRQSLEAPPPPSLSFVMAMDHCTVRVSWTCATPLTCPPATAVELHCAPRLAGTPLPTSVAGMGDNDRRVVVEVRAAMAGASPSSPLSHTAPDLLTPGCSEHVLRMRARNANGWGAFTAFTTVRS